MASPSKAGNRLAAMSLVVMCVVALLPTSSALGGLSTAEKRSALSEHNRARRMVSPRACPPLAPMKWDSKLASVAQKYANKCKFQHNANRVAQVGGKYRYVGENIYSTVGKASALSSKAAIRSWNSEVAYYNIKTRKCEAGKMCGHYTQIVWASTTHVGCGAALCDLKTSAHSPFPRFYSRWYPYYVIYVCNYGPAGNVPRQPPYKKC